MDDSKESAPSGAIKASDFRAPEPKSKLGSKLKSKEQVNFDAGSPAASGVLLSRSANAPWWHSQFNLMLCAFALLGLAALLFVMISPDPDSNKVRTLVSAQGQEQLSESAVSQDAPAPWDESRRKQARTDSQEILAELLKAKKDLEARGVKQWGEKVYDEALAFAFDGDEFYKRKDFVAAVQNYQSALDKMQSLDELIPAVLNGLVKQGVEAIDEGKTELAREKFNEALQLDTNHIPALMGIDRANTLNQVLELVRSAAVDEQVFADTDELDNLTSALQKYEQAAKLDPRAATASDGIGRVKEAIAEKSYRDAMSIGFAALFSNRYNSAKQGFAKAMKIRPDDVTANAAYRQSLASDQRSSLSSLIGSAKRLERNEEWASALSTYEAVLQRDPNQLSAKLGKIRSSARKQLDQSIVEVLADPLALSRASARASAEKILSDAKAIKSKGAVLRGQITRLKQSIKQIDGTVKVSLRSDQLTEVSLLKAGSKRIKLGKFSSKNLALKPGRYVVSGERLGYQDERQEIELRVIGQEVQIFTIVCAKAVVTASGGR